MCSRCGCVDEPGATIRPAQVEGYVEAAVLSLLAEQPMHGYALVQEMEERQSAPAAAARIYEALRSLEAIGAVRGDDDRESGGPARRRFQVTAAGRRRLQRWRLALAGLQSQLERMGLAGDRPPRRRRLPD